ncbi:phosphoribosylglycinamide formyltransferase [Paenibacillus antibioticophila]|uniref:Phosphoribosylglycinamide formyltransferase n=1 Tax=Paenibacillus antibioticophila TaxID=1274374 RepID=A0A919XUF4_9BACL|nr:phosphoribosylglycinamide formyltransferase [Paenibacillus antibioticophila]GIO36603.1 phosphoribosylglycinamide formyltransferase [Paenibacillus antibioticophila]
MSQGCRIAVFASGNGSNFQALLEASREGRLGGGEIVLLVCDKPNAFVVERARQAGVETYLFRPKEYARREDYEAEIAARLTELEIDLVILAGYMRLLTPVLVSPYAGRMLNIHPSLLPAFPGTDAIGQAWNYGVKVTGVTVHLVDEGMDTGTIVAQEAVTVEPGEDVDSLTARIHQVEQRLYPQVVKQFAKGRVRVNGRKVELG